MVGAPSFVVSLLRRVGENGLPCRSRASPPAAPHRPPAPKELRPPRLRAPNPPVSTRRRARIGKVLWRVRAIKSRAAAGRVRPQEWILRRPTTTILDPGPSSAALVPIGFLPKTFVQLLSAQRLRVASPEGSGCRLFGIEDLFDPDAEFRPEILGEVEIRAKIEHSSLTDFRADSFRFDRPVGEVRAPVAG
jgi:hypothetical protein